MSTIQSNDYDKISEAKFKQVLSVSLNPLAEFIDYKRLFLSALFEQVWHYAARHYEKTGNTQYMSQLINMLPSTEYKLFLTGYSCERFALQASCKDKKNIVLRKNKNRSPDTTMRFLQCLADFNSSRLNIEKYKDGAYSSLKGLNDPIPKPQKKARSTDLLDSRLVYPGSFESGRRR